MKPEVVVLPGKNNFALIAIGKIVYGLDASPEELNELIKEISEEPECFITPSFTSVSTLGLMPTFDCNFNCIYCYARGGDTAKIVPLHVPKNAIKHVKESENSDVLRLNLVGGGEPLLPFGNVVEIVDYAKKLFSSVETQVVTNCSFGPKVFDWILKEGVVVRASYDGVMQDSQRPFRNGKSSKKIVTSNIRNMVEAHVPLTVSCVVTDEGVNTLRDTMDELIAMGVEAVEFEPARGTGTSRNRGWREPSPVQFAESLMDVIQYAAQLGGKIKIQTAYFSVPKKTGYCGISGKNMVVTPEGLVTACLQVAKLSDPYSDKLIYGKVEYGKISVNNKIYSQLLDLDSLIGRDDCQDCHLQMVCRGGCPMESVWESGFPLRKPAFTCAVEKHLLPRLLLAMVETPEIVSVVSEAEIL